MQPKELLLRAQRFFKALITFMALIVIPTTVAGDAPRPAPGLLFSDYLLNFKSTNSSLAPGSSFIIRHENPFTTRAYNFNKEIISEFETLPWRAWALDYVFHQRQPEVSPVLFTRGWNLADTLAQDAVHAATAKGTRAGWLRTVDFDLQSELGGRRAHVGLNVLGALRENYDQDALAWQLRGFKSSSGAGGSGGLIYRWLLEPNALAGVNVFLDYENYKGRDFWRWSTGTELRSAWLDLFGNYYQRISADRFSGDTVFYTASGYDVEMNLHSPDLPWLVGEITYYNWEGSYGDEDDKGLRFGVKIKPFTGLKVGVEYEAQQEQEKKSWSGHFSYTGKFNAARNLSRGAGSIKSFHAQDYWFVPVSREYSQRIRTAKHGRAAGAAGALITEVPAAALPLSLHSGAGNLALTVVGRSSNGTIPYALTVLHGRSNGQKLSLAFPRPYVLPTTATVTIHHQSGTALSLEFPQAPAVAALRGTALVAGAGGTYLRLVDGQVSVVMRGGGLIVERGRVDTANLHRNYQRFFLQHGHSLSFRLNRDAPRAGATLSGAGDCLERDCLVECC